MYNWIVMGCLVLHKPTVPFKKWKQKGSKCYWIKKQIEYFSIQPLHYRRQAFLLIWPEQTLEEKDTEQGYIWCL